MSLRIGVILLIFLAGLLIQPVIAISRISQSEEEKMEAFQTPRSYLAQLVDEREFVLLEKIIQAESNWKPQAFNSKTRDYGLCQISERYWDKELTALGLDYKNDWRDNLKGCVYILEKQGSSAWLPSKKIWSKM